MGQFRKLERLLLQKELNRTATQVLADQASLISHDQFVKTTCNYRCIETYEPSTDPLCNEKREHASCQLQSISIASHRVKLILQSSHSFINPEITR